MRDIFIKLPPRLRNNCADVFYNNIVGKNEGITAERERYDRRMDRWHKKWRKSHSSDVKKSSYVRECTKAHYVLMFDKDEMNELMKQIRGIAANINQVAYRANSTGNIYGNDIADLASAVMRTNNLKNRALPKIDNALFLSCDKSSSHAACNIMCKTSMAH